MKKKGYYSSGEFARMAHCTLRTVRWYDREGLLSPSAHTESGARLYTDKDLVKMQQILLFKYLGFSLEDIREMTAGSVDQKTVANSLMLQRKLTEAKIMEMQAVLNALDVTSQAVSENRQVDWAGMLETFHQDTMQESLQEQYHNAANINARIRLHHDYSVNPEGWYRWLFRQYALVQNEDVFEAGCGNGQLWIDNQERIPAAVHVILSDSSEGMVQEVQKRFGYDERFACRKVNIEDIPYADHSFDLVIANHMLFYCDDLTGGLSELKRVLKKKGMFACSAYGKNHMKEVTQLVQEFDPEIVLSKDRLYEKFGLENGKDILSYFYKQVECRMYEDEIVVSDAQPLIAYILSCHGNQNEILLHRYHEFSTFVSEKVKDGFHITKEAGTFLCRNS